MASQSGGGSPQDAKHVLDEFGQQVHKEVKKEAERRSKGELKGLLTSAKLSGGEIAGTTDPCSSDYTKHFEANSNRYPCGNTNVDRFPDNDGAECDNSKIKGNKGKEDNSEGACAPYRRLSLCNKNFQNNNNDHSSNAKHDLLLDVCMAANYEAQSLITYHDKHELTNVGSQICTVLARSFADIGDIVRGKDLYLGKKKKKKTETERERDQLEQKLKGIFKKIYEGLTGGVKDHYQDTDNYYELREDWWALNRDQVWKAITCKADNSNRYFRATCDSADGKGSSVARNKCRCKDEEGKNETNEVPTYFDYVPQYLRWFEEWAEDFCRKKKKYVDIVKTYCRGKYQGEERYCSRNGFDCEKTVNARGKVRMGKGCTDCFFACNPYVDWIDNQRKQFLKQRNKYADEIKIYTEGASGGSRQRRNVRSNYDNGYEKKFYKELKNRYGSVETFLVLLNNEKACTAVDDDKGGKIDFKEVNTGGAASGGTSGTNVESQGTFYRSKYCQPCPLCGVERKGGSGWEEKDKIEKCKSINLYKPRDDKVGTTIKILKSGEEEKDIETKLKAFCDNKDSGNSDPSLYDPWQCYQIGELTKDQKEGGEDDLDYEADVQTGGGLCILKKEKKTDNDPDEIQKTFNNFFYYWVAHMLKDSIYWRMKKLERCLQNGNKKCGNQKCEKPCDCFQRWVQQKETEWGKIKTHFNTQNIGALTGCNPIVTLEGVLKLQFLKDESTEDSEENSKNSLDSEELKHLKHLSEMLQGTGVDGLTCSDSGTEQKTLMDKLIDYEEGIATECKKCDEPKPEGAAGGRSDGPPGSPPRPAEKDEDHHSDESDEEEDEEHTEQGEEKTEGKTEEQPEEVKEHTETPEDEVNPCKIVETLFTSDDNNALNEACKQKYQYGKEKFPNWKCIPSGDNSTTSSEGGDRGGQSRAKRAAPRESTTSSGDTTGGSICVPPRRRKLYIKKIVDWAESQSKTLTSVNGDGNGSQEVVSVNGASESGSQGSRSDSSSSSSSDSSQGTTSATSQSPNGDLLTAFVESAAIETFFLWDRYKKIKDIEEKEIKEKNEIYGIYTSSVDEKPQNKLNGGDIPNDFLRLMFYTLGDYRDICIGVKEDVIKALEASSDKNIETIKKAIDEILSKQSRNNQQSGQKSENPRDTWWKTNGEHIWNAMVCALTYNEDTSGAKGKQPQQDQSLKDKLIDKKTGKPEGKYHYEKVTLENSDTQAISNDTINNPKLKDFVEIPPFFRWLHEWGSDFCGKRARMLKNVKHNCRNIDNPGHQYCSGDGYDCEKIKPENYKNISDLDCRDCYKQCRKYRKWIEKKVEEFHKQEKKYKGEHGKLRNDNCSGNDNKEYCEQIKQKTSAADFLAALKHCKNDQIDGEQGNQEDKKNNEIKFEEPLKTFGPLEYCKTCPFNGVNCTVRRGTNGCIENGQIWKKVFEGISGNGENSTITVDMIDRRGPFIEKYLGDSNDLFKTSKLFKGIRKQNWTCKFNKDKNMDVCHLTNFKDNIDLNEYTTFKVLLIYWLEDFLYGYYLLKKKKKIYLCTQNKEQTCSEESKNDCACVKEWIGKKRAEWKTIRDRFNDQYKSENSGDTFPVRSFLEGLIPQIPVADVQGNVIKLSKFGNSCGCSFSAHSTNGKDDAIDCMIKKLEEKVTSCLSSTSGDNLAQCENSTPLEDDDEPFEEEENPENMRPGFCPPPEEKTEIEGTDKKCEEAPTTPPEPAPPAKSGEGTEELPSAPEPPQDKALPKPAAQPKDKKRPKRQPQNPWEHPIVIPSLATSTLMWTVGIGFATFTYFFLKKKTKSSVGNLFQILQIPKGDYDIPTLKSSNRYIPYASERYKGKTYIYMEGDSSGDEKYAFMSDTTDVTSSESEYEEMDINDIYAPRAPKYKTLIEVILEPSKRDTQNDIPSGDINSDIPNTPSDTPSPITDEEWNTLKDDFISNMLQNEQEDIPQPDVSKELPLNTHPTPSHDTLDQKPFIMSIHDRNLLNGEEYSYDIINNIGNNDLYSGFDPKSGDNVSYSGTIGSISDKTSPYSGIDLINDSLNSGNHIDIYDEILKRKENELFGTNHVKHISTHSVAKLTNSDPIECQLNLFHKWLDRHRDMCEKFSNNKEELLDKLKEQWENKTHSGNKHSDIPSGKLSDTPSDNNIHSDIHPSDIPSGKQSDIPSDNNIHSDIPYVLNSDVSIQIDMDNPNQVDDNTYLDTYPDKSTMDTIMDDLEKYNEPYYDIYYDVNDHDASNVDSNNMDVPSKVKIEMSVKNTQMMEGKYPIGDVWDI
ncbi:erythrocyte membrane protein 1 [Plasmodium falciparum NF54]|uniref:Erythrocyte membrane protein 1, PfEMP1 n=4 Tax=Plasmodium falciparum TaxID=5833 RepID=Q8IBX1_PLAF7|nr:erythrocyte membrane protein 1, PfEMP1 [Plasmodium falciparum 3D7]KAF4326707.1 erythrocyte membrane protein 1 [Plasmodium falciparum NF54]PKC42313.1 erythrocyte membrane protein 1 [Plasmodium falciparum NF54]CAD50872.1 erythrocyte membrane protein 1, PfEMP1 [Plasmodium falciparum 3D7]|eukprot:XP_001349032.1 erythrocyte membrane protein 1, PfEMP1 [Plasmodium falciparum 3D7]